MPPSIHRKDVLLRVERNDTPIRAANARGEVVRFAIAQKDGSYFADDRTLQRLEGEGRSPFRIATPTAKPRHRQPHGSRQQHRRHLQ